MGEGSTHKDREPGTDAVCFTAGPLGIPFSSGVVHAFLAAGRKAPVVAAGVSGGALSAAALARACHEVTASAKLNPEERESRRWDWYRRYLDAVTNQPLKPIWDAIPDPVDYFADKPPVRDLSVENLGSDFVREEEDSRRHYFRLVKLGQWLSGLPLSVGDVAACVVRWVRFKEQYPRPLLWLWEGVKLLFAAIVMALDTLWHLCRSPQFIFEKSRSSILGAVRPLFGWRLWLLSIGVMLDLGYWLARLALHDVLLAFPGSSALQMWYDVLRSGAAWQLAHWTMLAVLLLPAAIVGYMLSSTGGTVRLLSKQLHIEKALLHAYALRRRLFEVFCDSPLEPATVGQWGIHLLIVAAPLEPPGEHGPDQVWFAPGAPLVDALLAAMAVPGLFQPIVSRAEWISGADRELNLIDGALVRQNPLPALFRFLKDDQDAARRLCGDGLLDASVHLVYNVPVGPASNATRHESLDIVAAAAIGIDLSRRRDSRMEFRQTNFISELALHIEKSGGETVGPISPIFADEIAPPAEIEFENNLAPTREESLKTAATGCRMTLETLYRGRLQQLSGQFLSGIPCDVLLRSLPVSGRDPRFITAEAPGLGEICHRCTRILHAKPEPTVEVRKNEERWRAALPLETYGHLAPVPHRPRVVFLAAGGVFRGAFHIGVIGALKGMNLKPDLIVGASVGTLMGAALGAISAADGKDSSRLLGQLCLTFLEVDSHVALTKTLKNAMKQLGVRGRSVDLSPAALRRAVRKGTRADAAFAATGAPAVLIDAISTLFLIPHGGTREIASEFVAGHIAGALNLFWKTVRKETLRRLGIENEVIGTSLLEERARALLGDGYFELNKIQPYRSHDYAASLFGTASDLGVGRGILLPRDLPAHLRGGVYDFVQSALASSAFPAAFRPRQQAEVLPGRGATDVLYADGGVFDNLPFFPALEVLSTVQSQQRQTAGLTAQEYLCMRLEAPDLLLAASLDCSLDGATGGDLDTFIGIHKRAAKLNANVKLESFVRNAQLIRDNVERLLATDADLAGRARFFADAMVNAGVLTIMPTGPNHLNGTFAFSRAVGFDQKRVASSIADGCYRTFSAMIDETGLASKALASLRDKGHLPLLSRRSPLPARSQDDYCRYFEQDGRPFRCPFTMVGGNEKAAKLVPLIFKVCVRDDAHRYHSVTRE